jgi:hypothetical protein
VTGKGGRTCDTNRESFGPTSGLQFGEQQLLGSGARTRAILESGAFDRRGAIKKIRSTSRFLRKHQNRIWDANSVCKFGPMQNSMYSCCPGIHPGLCKHGFACAIGMARDHPMCKTRLAHRVGSSCSELIYDSGIAYSAYAQESHYITPYRAFVD